MLRIFLTGDNHIGLRYASHEASARLAAARLEAFSGMVEAANAEGCQLFAVTGDLFDRLKGIPKRDVKALAGILAGFEGTVALLPGNHDYFSAGAALWDDLADAAGAAGNILLLTEPRPYPLTLGECEATLYPAPCESVHSAPGENNLGWIKAADIDRSRVNIGLAHGAVEGETIDSEGRYFLMTRRELEDIPVDLWLLGHTHVPFPRLGADYAAAGRIFNAGTHMQTDVSCNCEGQCFVIELDGDRSVRAKKLGSGPVRFYRRQAALAPGRMEELLLRELKDIGPESVVDLRISGAVTPEEYDGRAELLGRLLSRFIEGTYNDAELSRLVTEQLIDAEFAETSFAAGFLKALLDEPKEAQLAYELLISLGEGKR